MPGRGRLTGLPGALLLGERTEGRLRYIGSVGTGWSERERAALAGLLSVAAVASCPLTPVPRIAGAHWVLPRLVGEVTYTSRTRVGYLRHPSWHRLRPDLAPGTWRERPGDAGTAPETAGPAASGRRRPVQGR